VKYSVTAVRLLILYAALQRRDTTFGQVLNLSAECGLDGRRVLADHFNKPVVIPGSLEA
jgi:hypothetical protein